MIESFFLGSERQQVIAVLILETHSLGVVEEDFEIGLRA
jgi:hypothetical protein